MKRKWRNCKCSPAMLLPLLLLGPVFFKVLLHQLSGGPRQLEDELMYKQRFAEFSKLDTSELTEAPGVHIVCVFPNNTTNFTSGENYVLLVGAKNKGKLPIQLFGLRAHITHPNDLHHPVQDFEIRLSSWIVPLPPTYTATLEYKFSVSQSVKGGAYNLVGSIMYGTEEERYQNTFHNGTVDVAEADHDDPIMVMDVIVSVLLALFYIGICVFAYCVINNGVTKKVKKFVELAYNRPYQRQQGNRRRWR